VTDEEKESGEKLVSDPLCLRKREDILRNYETKIRERGLEDMLEHVLLPLPQSPLLREKIFVFSIWCLSLKGSS